jgi:hypothetical protein
LGKGVLYQSENLLWEAADRQSQFLPQFQPHRHAKGILESFGSSVFPSAEDFRGGGKKEANFGRLYTGNSATVVKANELRRGKHSPYFSIEIAQPEALPPWKLDGQCIDQN